MQFDDELEEIYTVSRLNNEVRFILEDTFPFIWVEGEIFKLFSASFWTLVLLTQR